MSKGTGLTTQQRWVLALTSLGSMVVALDSLVVATALTTIQEQLGASLADLEWTVNAYNLTFAVLMLSAAAAGDRWGRRRVFAGGFALFTLASAACALATSVDWLIAARAVQGVGAAVVMPLAMGLLGATFPPERRGWATGVFSSLTGLAVLSGPVVGGAITQGLDWHWVFWINVPVGLVLVPLTLKQIPESHGGNRRLDLVGAGLAAVALLGVVWALIRGPEVGWSTTEVLGSLVIGLIVGVAFVGWERRAPAPMLPLSLFKVRSFVAVNLAGLLLAAALIGTLFFLSQFVQVVLHDGPFAAGLRLLPWTATLFVIAPIAGRLVDRVGERPLVVLGLAAQGLGLLAVAALSANGLTYGELLAPMVIAGAGVSVAMTAAQSGAVAAVPGESVGVGSGVYGMTRQVGSVAGIAIAAAAFAWYGGYASPHEFERGFTAAMVIVGALSLAGAVAGAGLSPRAADRPSAMAMDRA
ncbi:DHA2 family efflux MFS transporter permease subunit [Kribbella yunnanensis]|uniref:DHA2 family efflux MFS transporter permease subunit n=1 Tax=Kribbella yunnanensis TaxID=190194 RepID=A0ABN2H1L9_9ACTN